MKSLSQITVWSLTLLVASLSTIVQAQDNLPPAIRCKTGVVVVLPSGGSITVDAEDFDDGTLDNVTNQEDLIFYLNNDPNKVNHTINCDSFESRDVLGELIENLYFNVADEAGNVSTCEVTLEVQDNKYVCGRPDLICNGCVQSWNSGNPLPVRINCSQDTSACYSLIVDQPQTLTLCREWDPLNGVSTADLVVIQRHLLGLETFSHFLQYRAADANSSGSITAGDISAIRKLVLGVIANFEQYNVPSWRFYRRIDSTLYTEDLDFSDTTSCPSDKVVAVKMGDLHYNEDSAGLIGYEPRSDRKVKFYWEKRQEGWSMRLTERISIIGLELQVKTPKCRVQVVNSEVLGLSEEMWHQSEGHFSLSWIDVYGKQLDPESSFLDIGLNIEHPPFFSGGFVINSDLEVIHLEQMNEAEEIIASIELSPNPVENGQDVLVKSNASIEKIEVFNLAGKKVLSVKGASKEIILNGMELNSGLYLVRVETDGGFVLRKLVIQ